MGVHDFICHIEHNDQFLSGIELLTSPMTTEEELTTYVDCDIGNRTELIECLKEERNEYQGCGASTARLVLLPRTMSLIEVKSLKLEDFALYPTLDVEYDWDDWDFISMKGYREFLLDESFNGNIWYDSNHWIVNFSPISYEAFVLNKHSPNLIPIGWYLQTLNNREVDIEDIDQFDKDSLYSLIVKMVDNSINE